MQAATRLLVSLLALTTTVAVRGDGVPYPQMEQAFRQDDRWLGSDGASSTPLGDGRTFWTFEDSFVALSDARQRRESRMIRNTIALQGGQGPGAATLHFYWRETSGGQPADYFPGSSDHWYWTGGAMDLQDGPLVVFLTRMVSTPNQGLGFRNDGYALALLSNTDGDPRHWPLRIVPGPELPFDAIPATTLLRQGEHIIGLALRQAGTHAGALVRYRVDDLIQGDLTDAEWWAGQERGWLATEALGPGGPAFVIDDAGNESTIHWDPAGARYLHVATYGFGAATIGLRTAPRIEGPWTAPWTIYEPPELGLARPFIYSAQAHPHLPGLRPGDLVVTYATNAWRFEDLLAPPGSETLYWPRVVSVSLLRGAE